MVRSLWRSGLAIVLLGFALNFSLSLRAQTISGIIAGQVKDQSGAATSAAITATNTVTGRVYTGSAGEDGNYRIMEVYPGDYDVKAESPGFETVVYQNLRVDVNRTSQQDFTLPISTQATTVTVTAQSTAPFRETSAPTLRTDFNARDVHELPILTRDVNNLALLAPGVADVRTFSFGSTLVPFTTNGSRGRDNNFIIDSVSNNEPLLGGAAAQFTNTDVFAEYTVLTNQVKAEFGRNSGATINAITKAGSQYTHGSLFWFGQDQSFNALTQAESQALLTAPPNSYENQAGFTLGGPLLKSNREKLQYFLSYQWDGALNNLSSVFPVLNTLPTANGLSTLRGLSSAATPALNALLNTPTVYQVPATVAPCFGSTPLKDPMAQVSNPCYAPTLVPINSGAQSVEYGTYLVPNGNVFNQHDHQASGRLDYKISNTDDVYGRYLFDDLRTPRATLDPAGETAFGDLGQLAYWRDIFHQRTQSMLLNERHGWVNSLNEFRVSVVRILQNDGALNVAPSVQGEAAATIQDNFGGFGSYQGNFPSAGRLFSLGSDIRPTDTASNVAEVQENFSYSHGKHSFKFGADLIRTGTNVRNMPEDLGHYFFSASLSATGVPGLSQLVNEPASCAAPPCTNAGYVFQRLPNVLTDGNGNVTGEGPEELPLREFDQFFFAQDDWRVSPNLTLNLGFRYENFGQPINRIAQFNSAAPHVADDNHNFAPRIGFAWSPANARNTVFRGGYGIMYDPMVLNIPLLIWQSGPISPLVQYFSGGLPGTVQTAATPSGVYPNLPFQPADLNVRVPGCNFLKPSAMVPLVGCSEQETVDPHLVNPYVQSWSFGIQHSFSPNLLLEIDYVGNKGTENYQRIDTNPFGGWDEGCLLTFGRSYSCLNNRSNPGKGDIQEITNGGLSSYNAMQASVTKRTAHRPWGDLAFTASYTLSHLIDNSSEAFSPGGVQILNVSNGNLSDFLNNPVSGQLVDVATPLPEDSRYLQNERGNSSYDRRNRVAVSFVYELPHSNNLTGFSKALVDGWQLNGVEEIQTGQPFSPLNGSPLGPCADAAGEGILTNDRPAMGSLTAPVNTVALVDDTNCISVDPSTQHQIQPSNTGYIDLNGNPIDPRLAHFVQTPLGFAAGQAFVVPSVHETFIAGSAGRNTLNGPNSVNLDLALYKNFSLGEHKSLQFRCEVYDLMNHPNAGFPIGNVFAARAQQTYGYAFSPRTTPAAVTGLIPENTIDGFSSGVHNFLSTQYMNTSSRRMQFGIHFVF